MPDTSNPETRPENTDPLFIVGVFAGIGTDAVAYPNATYVFIENDAHARDLLLAQGHLVFSSVERLLHLVSERLFAMPKIDILTLMPSCRGISGARTSRTGSSTHANCPYRRTRAT